MTKSAKAKGRPSKFTQAIADEICARLTQGEPLAVICRDAHMPDPATVWRWQQGNAALTQAIAHARDLGFDALAAECLEIAEDGSQDYAEKKRPDGSTYEAFDSEHVQRSKLRIDTRLKLLSKWDPKRYGDKVAHVGGTADDAPIQTALTVKFV